jgi:hypothetical protein
MMDLTKIKPLSEKISSSLRSTPILPPLYLFDCFLAGILTKEEREYLDEVILGFGQERAQSWLSSILVDSGKFRWTKDGSVEPKALN